MLKWWEINAKSANLLGADVVTVAIVILLF
jgi:hypothetical protein